MNGIAVGLVAALAIASSASAATLEVPQNGGRASGVGYISGWKCPPNDNLTAVIDGDLTIPLASGIARGDTAGACGNDGRNGYIAQINWGLLGDGLHTVSIRRNGAQFAGGSFSVATFGTPFMTGASGAYTLQNFPSQGRTARIQWVQGAQNFVIVDTAGNPVNPTPTPRPNPTATPAPATATPAPTHSPGSSGLASLIGTWDFRFTIISTFVDRFFLPNDIRTVNGVRTLVGESDLGNLAIVARVQDLIPGSPVSQEFVLFTETIISCEAHFFSKTGANTVSGFYTSALLIGGECGNLLGQYAMTGVRVSNSAVAEAPASTSRADATATLRIEEAAETVPSDTEAVDSEWINEAARALRALGAAQ